MGGKPVPFKDRSLAGQGGAPAVEIDFANPFHARQDVIDRLAASPYEFSTDDLRHEVAWHLQNLLHRGVHQPAAQNRCHRPGQRLHLRTQGDSKSGPLLVADFEENTNRIGTLFILADVLQTKRLTLLRLPFSRLVGVRNERIPFFLLGQRFKQTDNFLQPAGIDGFSFVLRVPGSILHIA